MPDRIIYNNIRTDTSKQIMSYWLKINGTGDSPFVDGDWYRRRQRWVGDYGQVSMFPRVPSIEPGDRLIEYAAGSARYFGEGRLFAVSEAVSDPEPSPHERWPVQVRTRTLVAGPRLEYCPSVDDIGVMLRSLGRHSHIRLTEDQGREAEELIAAAAREFGSLGG
jgi:hypothetical protein